MSTVLRLFDLAGAASNCADHVAFAAFQWTRLARPATLLSADDPINGWIERMLDAYGGLARSARCAW